MKILVIADIHLTFKDAREDRILEFFDTVASKFEKIVILGDFFEFWYGFKKVIIWEYFNILHKLHNLTLKGIDVVFIEGNHDFNMGDFFENFLNIKVCTEKYQLKIGDRSILFIHGDTVNIKEDKFYRRLRKFLRSKFVNFLMNNIPPYLILQMAEKFSSTSRKYLYKSFNLEKVIDNYSECGNYDYIVSGHFHRNFHYKNFYIIGDWFEKFNYMEIDEKGNLEYKTF